MSQEGKLVQTLEQLKAKEIEVAEVLAKTAEKADNAFVKCIVHALVYDSRKHAQILQSLIDFKTGKVESSFVNVGMGSRVELSNSLRAHEMIEGEMTTAYSKLAHDVDDPLVSRFVESIADDEKRHHKAIAMLIDTLGAQDSSVSEIWDSVARSLYVLVRNPEAEVPAM